MKIITLTLNPAFDIHLKIDDFKLYQENYVTSMVKHAGGKGVNISRALWGVGVENTTCCILGSTGGEEFLNLLQKDGLCVKTIITEGRIRENMTLHSKDGETRISFEGLKVDREILEQLFVMIEIEKSGDLFVTLTGRLPQGITNRDAIDFLGKIKSIGAKLVVDCNSFTKEELYEIKPFLIKPNKQELSNLLGKKVHTENEVILAAENMQKNGIEQVVVSLGHDGFIFWSSFGGYNIAVPEIEPVSTIGAGDSLIAGYLCGLKKGYSLTDTLKLAAAFGTAACMTEGTNPPDEKDINLFEQKIVVTKI